MDSCLNLTRLFRVSKAHARNIRAVFYAHHSGATFRANVIDGDQGHLNVRPSWTEVSLQPPFRLGGDERAGKLARSLPPATY